MSASQPTVLHIFDHSLPLQSGYSFRSLSILHAQRQRGWQTHQLTSVKHYQPGPDPEPVGDLLFDRTPQLLGWQTSLPVMRELLQIRALEAKITRKINAVRPDILHAHSPALNAVAALRVARAHHLPIVYEIRGTWEDAAVANGTTHDGSVKYRLTRAMEQYVATRVDALGVICEGLQKEFLARGIRPERLFTVPNAVDPDLFTPDVPRDAQLAGHLGLSGKKVIGFVGSFYPYEGLDILLQSMPQLRAQLPDLRLLLVGGGPEAERLRMLVNTLGLDDVVVMPGRVPHADVERYYALIDILVFPRKRTRVTELVTPLKPLEAYAQGKLVAASDVGGHKELVRDGETGALFKADDPQALATAVINLFARAAEWPRLRANALHYVREERTWANTVARHVPVYTRLTGFDWA